MEPPRRPLANFIEELQTRRVTRVAVTYIAFAFAALQGADLLLSPLGGARAYRWIVIATLAGFPLALALAWFFDLRREPPTRAGEQVPAAADRSPGGRFSRRRVVLVVALVLAGLGLYAYRVAGRGKRVATDAEVIAIAPFTAVGGEVSALGEGMAQLLAANLDQVGGLRTVDAARVLRAWREDGSERRSEEEALALAGELGAGSVLMGSVVAAGDDVRLSAMLRALDGREIARAQVTGSAADVLALADSLSNRLLREIWRSRSPIPQLRIAAITTSNLDAIRAYLDGERHYRELRWDSATVALLRAVELDSTFALAHRRLAGVYAWSDGDSPLRTLEEAAAVRTPERLPERERAVALAYVLWHQQSDYRGALDSLDSHLRRYPDDAEALALRAEVLLHGNAAAGFTHDDSMLLAAFEAALRVDPDLLPAMLHPVDLSARLGDSVRYRRYATRVLSSRSKGEAEVALLVDSAIGLLWDREPGAGRFVRRFLTDTVFRNLRGGASPLLTLLGSGRDPNSAADALLAGSLDGFDTPTLFGAAHLLVGIGRLDDAARVLDLLEQRAPIPARRARFDAVAFGIAGADFVPRVLPDSTSPAVPASYDPGFRAAMRAILDLGQGDTASAARGLAAAQAGRRLPPAIEAVRRFSLARLQVLRGDVAGGLREMETALRAAEAAPRVPIGPPPSYHRIFLATAQSEYAPTRKRGIAELERLRRRFGPPLDPFLRIYIARALEADGRPGAAIEHYRVFALQTRRAQGRLAQLNQEAQAALARLTIEP